MKKSKFLLVAIALLSVLFVQSCTKDNEVKPKIENQEFELIYGATDEMSKPRKKRKKR